MKPSHLTTPRSLDDAVFEPNGQAFFKTSPSHIHPGDRLVAITLILAALFIAFLLGWYSI